MVREGLSPTDGSKWAWHARTIIHLGDRPVGYLQVGAYGHKLRGEVGIGFIAFDEPMTPEVVKAGDWGPDFAGEGVVAPVWLISARLPFSRFGAHV